MPDNLKDILTNLSTDIDQETLLLYLQNQLSEEKKHEVEKLLVDSQFEDEALEGLQEFKNKKAIAGLVEQLNYDLRKRLEKKKKRREKLKLKEQPLTYMVILLILLLIIISYFIIHHYLQLQPQPIPAPKG
jgi:hypothetical protein